MSAGGAAVAGAAAAVVSHSRRLAASQRNERVRVGFLGTGSRGRNHMETVLELWKEGAPVEVAAVCDVFQPRREHVASHMESIAGRKPRVTVDYHEILDNPGIDAVCIATPDHWHARMLLDALAAGKHIYCEKPMTRTSEEALQVLDAAAHSDRVVQIGTQSAALPIWDQARDMIAQGKLGKIVHFQTEYCRNSTIGQWRYYELTRDMNPRTIDWQRFLGADLGLAPDAPFDRARFAQWRRFWDYGSGLYSDLFVHRVTPMLKCTGLRFPGRVCGGGGIFIEYDGRDVPDAATVVADFDEGVQGVVSGTMNSERIPERHVIRGHHGSIVFDAQGGRTRGFHFLAEKPDITGDSKLVDESRAGSGPADATRLHWENFLQAIAQNRPELVHCPPDLGAAAVMMVELGARSYREGKVYGFDPQRRTITAGDSAWAERWESMSRAHSEPRHVPVWTAATRGSLLKEPEYQRLEGPWVGGHDPAPD